MKQMYSTIENSFDIFKLEGRKLFKTIKAKILSWLIFQAIPNPSLLQKALALVRLSPHNVFLPTFKAMISWPITFLYRLPRSLQLHWDKINPVLAFIFSINETECLYIKRKCLLGSWTCVCVDKGNMTTNRELSP